MNSAQNRNLVNPLDKLAFYGQGFRGSSDFSELSSRLAYSNLTVDLDVDAAYTN